MRKFILLATLSPQGLQTLQVTPERLLEVNREIEDLGGRVLDQWAVLGYYDFLSFEREQQGDDDFIPSA